VLVAAGACASLLALSGLIAPGRWLAVACIAVVAAAAVAACVRAVTRVRWAPTLVVLVLCALGLVVRYGGRPGTLPGPDSVRRTIDVAHEGMAVINASLVPMTSTPSTELLVVTGGLAVVILADLLALGLGAPAWAGLAYVALWAPTVALGFPASGWALAWTAAAYLLLLALGAAPPTARTDRTRRASVVVACSTAVIVATLAAGPAVAALPGWASLRLPDFGTGPVGPLRLSDDLDLRDSLGARSGQVVLRYSVSDGSQPDPEPARSRGTGGRPADEAERASDAPAGAGEAQTPEDGASAAWSGSDTTGGDDPDVELVVIDDEPSPTPTTGVPTARLIGPLRAFTLTSFDGRTWERTDAADLDRWNPRELLSSDPTVRGTNPDSSRGTVADVVVQIDGLRESRLPISTFPRTVAVAGPWGYDAARDEVVGRRETYGGMRYTMRVEIPDLTADDLRFAAVGDPGDGGATLALPTTEHVQDIVALAASLTQDATTPYEQAMALQSFFRSAAEFTYDTRVPPARTDDAVWDFLQSRRGYCVQFATAMTVMARSLGIPARVGVGFLPGDPSGDGSYVVTGRSSHAWPELYFQGLGWVRFEPTPAVQTGAPPEWSDPFASVSTPQDTPDNLDPGAAAPSTAPSTAPSIPQILLPQNEAGIAWTAVGGTVLVVLAAAAAVLVVVRRRRRARTDLTPERAWRLVRRRLATRGVAWSDTDTPRTAVTAVLGRVRERSGTELDDVTREALTALARAVEQDRYALRPAGVDAGTLGRWADEAVRGTERALNDRSRDAAPSAPRAGT